MIDFEHQPAIKRAVARLETRDGTVGTGYLVAGDRVATCYHVVKDVAEDEPIACRFGELGELRTAFLVRRDQPSDAAVLRLEQPVSAAPLALSDQVSAAFWIHGYPHFTEGTAVSLDGHLLDPDTVDPHGIRAFAMFSPQFAGRTPESIGGLSGSPVMDGRRVIGHMSSVLGSKEARKAPHFGYAFAVRSTGVAQLLGTALPAAAAATPTTAPGAAEDRTIALTQVFDEIEASISSAEIQAALARGREAGSITDATRLFAAERMIGMTALPAALAVLQETAASHRRTELEALVSSLQGDHARALALLQRLPRSPETAGMIGGTLKRRWLQTHADIWLKAARVAYSAEYDRAKDPYLGINVAACSLWLHDRAASQRTAAEVSAALSARPDRTAWDEATLAEAYLLLEDVAAARRQYDAAVLRNLGQPRAIAIMRRQARLELAQLGRPSDAFDDLFPVPRIAAFTGHRIDDDEGGRFPPSRAVAVGQEISRTLAERGIRSGYSSAASGGDILFLEALLAAGGEAHVVLPFPIEGFVRTSVGEPWRPRFERILEQVSGRVVVLSDRVPDDRPAAYRRCNEAIMVAAHAEGHLLDELPMLVALVSSASEATPGGTVEMIHTWATQQRGAILKIDPS